MLKFSDGLFRFHMTNTSYLTDNKHINPLSANPTKLSN